MKSMTRRKALGLLTGSVAAASSLGWTRVWAAGPTLTVTHFGGPYQALSNLVGKPFAASGLGTVDYEVAVSPAAVAKLQVSHGNPPFDVVMVSRSFGVRAQNQGLVEKLSASDFKNAGALIPNALPAAGWGVAMVLDTFDIMVDEKQVPKGSVTSWLDLWKPEFKGKLALPSAENGGAAFAFMACIVRAIGKGDMSKAVVDEAFSRMKALAPSVRVFYGDSVQPTQMIDRGDISVAPQFGIRIANQTKASPNIVKVGPKEGVLAVPYDLCIAKGSKNVALAKQYIDLTLGESVQEALTSILLATPARKGVVVNPDIAKLVTLDTSALWFQDEELAAKNSREWLNRYTREVQSA